MLKLKNITTLFLFFFCYSYYSISYATDDPLAVSEEADKTHINPKPEWLHVVKTTYYDGEKDDLVTAGYGFSKLSEFRMNNHFTDINNPTFEELKKARLNRYIDTKTGEGTFFGFRQTRLTPLFDGRVAGSEIQAVIVKGDERISLLLQIPLDFDKNNACIIAIPAMGSDGIYNARDIQIRGLWGLSHNCAVVYNDKGLGNAIFDFTHRDGYLIDGEKVNYDEQDNLALFGVSADQSPQHQANRYALKQLYSKQNPEAKWGEYVLNSIEFAFYQLNEMNLSTGKLFNKSNTRVLVYGASDGATAAIKAGEFDDKGIIDGIVAVNPHIQVANDPNTQLFIQRGGIETFNLDVKPLVDYSTYGALYIPCAIHALTDSQYQAKSPSVDNFFFAKNRCMALKKAGLLTKSTPNEQAMEALNKLYQYGWNRSMAYQLPYYYYTQSINYPFKYISEYGRYGANEHLCNYSVASIDPEELFNEGTVEPLTKTSFSVLWALNSGSLPINIDKNTVLVDLVNDSDHNSPRREPYSHSPDSDVIDYNLSGAICLREKALSPRVKKGLNEIYATGKLHNIKTLVIHGQLNVQNLPDYSSRAYVALNSVREGASSNLHYIEVENASYLNGDVPFDNRLVAIDYYGESAMDWLWSNITNNATLPDSQVVRAKIRGGQVGLAPTVTEENLRPILQSPRIPDSIRVVNGMIVIPK